MKQYTPLYLKYRPQDLSKVIGQEVVTKTLSNAIKFNKIVHAYLFCGPRGTGKTSTARILAKSLNCESGITTEPCGKCTNCESITIGNSLDVIEIDAASHRKVEDAEDLINRVNLGTYGSRYKIYIIDEVHMLTDHAFNALLKTLEEPPKNVIFILATTEENKVIPTIISRCQKLDFKTIDRNNLEEHVKYIAKAEKINIDNSIITFISKRANGCLRDAVSLLDQISVLQEENIPIDPKEVYTLFGTVDRKVLFSLLDAVLSFEKKTAITLGEDLVKSGKDIRELLKGLIEIAIDLTKAKIDSSSKKALCIELDNDLKILDKVTSGHLLKVIDRLHEAQSKLRFTLSQELQFMVEIMSILDEDFLVSFSDLKERVEKIENNGTVVGRNSETVKPTVKETSVLTAQPSVLQKDVIENEKTDNELETELSESLVINSLDSTWNKITSLINSNPTKTLLSQSGCYLLNLRDDLIEIGLSKDMFLLKLQKDERKKEMILQAVKLATGKELKEIRFKLQPRENEKAKSQTENTPVLIAQSSVLNKEDEVSKAVKDLLGARQID